MNINKLTDYILISFIVISLAFWLPRVMLFLDPNFDEKPVKNTYLNKELNLFNNYDSTLIKSKKKIEQPINLSINLKGIITSSTPNSNIATISINNNELNLYSEGQEISKGIKLLKINIDHIVILLGNNKKIIYLDEKNKFTYLIDKSNDDGRLDMINKFLESNWEKEVTDFKNLQSLEKKSLMQMR